MLENFLDPVILFFVLGVLAGVLKSDLRIPEVLYETLSIYLLVAIGLKGGVELSQYKFTELIVPAIGTIFLGVVIPLIAYPILRRVGKLKRPDAASIAAHYGSVSAVTFAVVLSFLSRLGVSYEGYMTVLLVLLEVPAIAIGIAIARLKMSSESIKWRMLFHEVFLGKSIFLLVGGLLIGVVLGPERTKPVDILFVDLFKGALTFFLLEMGIVASRRLADLRSTGFFLLGFGICMPLFSGFLGVLIGTWAGLSIGGTTVLATLAASASYIAAPAAMRIAVPEAKPTLSITASLGITFPFNIIIGIPVYYQMAQFVHSWGG